jgi:hypothetical protein
MVAAAENLDSAGGYTGITNRMIHQSKNNKSYYLIQSWNGYENFGATVEFTDRGSHTFFMRNWNGNTWGSETRYDGNVKMSTSEYNFLWSKNDVLNVDGTKFLTAGINRVETVKQELVRRTSALEAVGATKTESSSVNGNVKINGVETPVYSHPTNPVAYSIDIEAQTIITTFGATLGGYTISAIYKDNVKAAISSAIAALDATTKDSYFKYATNSQGAQYVELTSAGYTYAKSLLSTIKSGAITVATNLATANTTVGTDPFMLNGYYMYSVYSNSFANWDNIIKFKVASGDTLYCQLRGSDGVVVTKTFTPTQDVYVVISKLNSIQFNYSYNSNIWSDLGSATGVVQLCSATFDNNAYGYYGFYTASNKVYIPGTTAITQGTETGVTTGSNVAVNVVGAFNNTTSQTVYSPVSGAAAAQVANLTPTIPLGTNPHGTTKEDLGLKNVAMMNIIDIPAATPSAYDDEFDGTSLAAKWTRLNSSIGAMNVANGCLQTNIQSNVETSTAIVQPIPTGDFTMTAKLKEFMGMGDCVLSGLILTTNNTDTTDFVRIGMMTQATNLCAIQQWTNFTTWSKDMYKSFAPFANSCYLRINRVGNVYTFQVSINGYQWITVYSGTLSITPGYIGITTGGKNNYQCVGTYDWFKVTTP